VTVKDDCPVCELNAWKVEDLPPRECVFSNEHWRALVRDSGLPGWLVVGLRRHVGSLNELTSEESISLGPVLAGGTQALIDVVGCIRSYVILFCEAMPHLHFNLLPRMEDMPADFRGAGVFGYDARQHLSDPERDDLGRRLAAAWPK
jgi:diadenosine tetraphosphate (Ap4A) HIT family hydrolase